jgi:hypothetical protein
MTAQTITLTTKRTIAPVLHGFSESPLVFHALTKGIAGSYSTLVDVTRKFLLVARNHGSKPPPANGAI